MDTAISILDWINFGKVSAERDDNLSKYFYDNGVLKSVVNSKTSFLVLGRKGAGKTAVFRYLSENYKTIIADSDLIVSLSFEDYNWNIHSLLVDPAKAESMLYKQSWRFVILVECIKAYMGWLNAKQIAPPKELKAASKLVERVFGSPIPSLYELIGNKILRLSHLKLPKAGFELDDGTIDSLNIGGGDVSFEQVRTDSSLKTAVSENITNFITYMDRGLACIADQWPAVYVCFDRVDEAWDADSFESSKKVIAGLVAAGNSINAQYRGKIRPLIFLREDIFDVLSINDANKLREDCGALLHWKFDTLSNLILERVNYYARQAGVSQVANLDAMFDRAEMRQRAKPSKYIMRRTMMRPRDVISFLTRVVDSMKDKFDDPFGEPKTRPPHLECESIYDAEPGYSEWLVKELEDEWRVQKPEILTLFTCIQNNGSTNFTKDDLSIQFDKLGKQVTTAELIGYLRFLFDNSIIGFKIGASAEWKFKCFYPSQGFLEADEYRVHEGLVRSMNLKEPRSSETASPVQI